MASIEKRTTPSGEIRWDVRYRGSDRRQVKKSFKRKVDAQRFANLAEADVLRGDWIDPRRSRETFGHWAQQWLATTAHLQPKTRSGYESILSKHLMPAFGDVPLSAIDHPRVLAYLSELAGGGIGRGTVRNIRDVLRLVLALAVRSGAIKHNPVLGARIGRSAKQEMVFLTADQVMTLADEIANPPVRKRGGEHRRSTYPEYGLLVRFAAFTGLRAGEIGALKVRRLDLMRRRVEVSESASEAHGEFEVGATKTYERRNVPVPAALIDQLVHHIAGKGPDDFVFESPDGGPVRHSNWYPRHFKPAVVRAGLPDGTRFHDLRHTYAAMLIAQGAHPRAMMERLGHSTIQVTLGTYGHLFPNLEESLDHALNQVLQAARPYSLSEISKMPTHRG
ncbi:MAG: tyrosine recombinase XerC [Ilumatobacteraceae bacterium]